MKYKFFFNKSLLENPSETPPETGQVSLESTPGETSNESEFMSAPVSKQKEYHNDIYKTLFPPTGDKIAKILGLDNLGEFHSPGSFEGETHPSTQILIKMPRKGNEIDPEIKKRVSAYNLVHGILLKQDAVGYHRPLPVENPDEANGLEIHLGTSPSRREVLQTTNAINRALYREVTKINDEHKQFGNKSPLIDEKEARTEGIVVPKGIRYINFTQLPNRTFQRVVESVIKRKKPDIEITGFKSDGDFHTNNWEENPHGEKYYEILDKLGLEPHEQRGLESVMDELALN